MAGKKGRSGRKRKPPQLKLVEGTFREDRDGSRIEAEAAAADAKAGPVPRPPSHLTTAGKRAWRVIAPQLHAKGLLADLETTIFSELCRALGEVIESERGIALELKNARAVAEDETPPAALRAQPTRLVVYAGRVVPGKNGWVRNPAVVTANQASQRIRDLSSEFGMTPSSFWRMLSQGGDAGDGVEAFRNRHPKAAQQG